MPSLFAGLKRFGRARLGYNHRRVSLAFTAHKLEASSHKWGLLERSAFLPSQNYDVLHAGDANCPSIGRIVALIQIENVKALSVHR
jgi:hypothetical protein